MALYELRVYEAMPGKMPALNERFRNTTTKFFAKHGIKVVGYWEEVIGISNKLTYMVEWENMAHRERVWDTFASDPDWVAARTKTEENGPLVARITTAFLRPTDYSPMR